SYVNTIGLPFVELQSVESSKNYAMGQVHSGLAKHGIAYFAHQQIAGKGQRGKSWVTEKKTNIIISVVVQPSNFQLNEQFHLNACMALAIHTFFKSYAGDETKIKWPNDIYWRDRKAAGILIENVVSPLSTVQSEGSAINGQQAAWKWAVVGIGININQTTFPDTLKNPVSLKQITGKNYNTVLLAKQLCESIDIFYKKLLKGGYEGILETYNENLYKKNETARLKKDNYVFEATIKGVADNGQLIVHNKIEERFNFGEVKWAII
ncbi:MAG: biotin--[acetyl-CoA-carboxylase] ligase, partial [Bacteroidota bacterium]|nr:biotin--[acetyl-CoA-carboxylase] ligase [Bacteroidota bacterium]